MATKKLQILGSLVKQAENADTLDGKHADEFAAASDVEQLQTLVGDASVAEQIEQAVEEKISAPLVATVGQVLIVKAVDENGKPTEWETVDMEMTAASLLGDVNGDGVVDMRDVELIQQYVSDPNSVTIIVENADINADGRIDAEDVMLLQQYVSGTRTLTAEEYENELASGKIISTTYYYICEDVEP